MTGIGALGLIFVSAAADGIVDQFGAAGLMAAIVVFGLMALGGERA